MEGIRGNNVSEDEELGGGREYWTNEKHVEYLNGMEASFVRTMLENNGRLLLRLDRYLPDTSDLINSSNHVSRRKKKLACNPQAAKAIMVERAQKRIRRQSSDHRYDPSQDQVVPDLQKKNVDK